LNFRPASRIQSTVDFREFFSNFFSAMYNLNEGLNMLLCIKCFGSYAQKIINQL
jgi:hypothetical protein